MPNKSNGLPASTSGSAWENAWKVLWFTNSDDAKSWVGQITTFNQLWFKGISYKPDWWYLPEDTGKVAIVLETKNSGENLRDKRWEEEMLNTFLIHCNFDFFNLYSWGLPLVMPNN